MTALSRGHEVVEIATPSHAAPVRETERIAALDVARGLALLGILTVNIHYFGWPLGDVLATHTPPKNIGVLDYAAWYYLRTFGEGKFFTVFSTLFGAGLTIQWARAHQRGLGFGALAFRRLGFLMLLGLSHALLLWYGDILFVYAWVGLLLLAPLHFRWSARTQVLIAVALLVVGSLLWGGVSALQGWGSRAADQARQQAPQPVAVEMDALPQDKTQPKGPANDERHENEASTPFGRLMQHWQSGTGTKGPDDPVWRDNEVLAYRHGPWVQSFLFRLMTWFSMIVMILFGFGIAVVAMFLAGSAMVKADVFRTASDAFFRRVAVIGFATGVPLSVMSTTFLFSPSPWLRDFVSNALYLPAGAAIAVGTIAAVALWTRSGRAAALARLIANTGRFGLTNYLLQTVVCTTVFYHWGFGLFGQLGGAALLGIAIGVWLVQVALSAVAVRYLQFGPLEWLWRTVTYWQRQPFLRCKPSPGTPVASISET